MCQKSRSQGISTRGDQAFLSNSIRTNMIGKWIRKAYWTRQEEDQRQSKWALVNSKSIMLISLCQSTMSREKRRLIKSQFLHLSWISGSQRHKMM